MRKFIMFLLGLISGAALGGVLGLILTPSSGPVLRKKICGFIENIKTEIGTAMSERRAELEAELDNLRHPTPPSQA